MSDTPTHDNVADKQEKEAGQPEAPQPVEPEAVEVSPEPTPGSKATLLGKDYEVTAERGHRLV